ncbi:MAG: hypothetical protein ACKO1J_09280 [Tagaea sp.]
MQAHEYSVVGHSRAVLGRWLFMLASVIAAAFTALGVVFADLARTLDLPDGASTWVIAPIGAAGVFSVMYFVFSKWGWRLLCVFGAFPRIGGRWACSGRTLADDGSELFLWDGTIFISQDWERIRVHLTAKDSGSFSVSASLLPEGDGRWLLMYSYRNEPRQGAAELNAHVGYCELHFCRDGKHAEGDYFTARGRRTAGRVALTKME